MTRDPNSYDPADGVEVRGGDLLDRTSFQDGFEDIDVAYYLVYSLGAGAAFAERDRRTARNFSGVASDADIDRVIYFGGLGETGEELSEHLRSRREVEGVLGDDNYALTTLRAAIIIGRGECKLHDDPTARR